MRLFRIHNQYNFKQIKFSVLCYLTITFTAFNHQNALATTYIIANPATTSADIVFKAANTQAQLGDTVMFPSGSFVFSEIPSFKSGVTYVGSVDTNNYLNTYIRSSTTSSLWKLDNQNNLNFNKLRFEGITLQFTNSSNINFDNTIFLNGYLDALKSDTYQLDFINSNNLTIKNSLFWRNNPNQPARNLRISESDTVEVSNNRFIGYLKSAINIGGYTASDLNTNIIISNNLISRFSSNPNYAEDHGIYAWAFDDLHINNNTIQGWSFTNYGGAIKVRNGKNLTITDNILNNSGILSFIYANRYTKGIQFFDNVFIANNTINLTSTFGNSAPNPNDTSITATKTSDNSGIIYYYTGILGDIDTNPLPYEKDIIISNNTVSAPNNSGSIKIWNSNTPCAFTITSNIINKIITSPLCIPSS